MEKSYLESQSTMPHQGIPPTNQIQSQRHLIQPAFGIAMLCFFLTFCNLTCGNQKIASVTGFDLVTGSDLRSQDMFDGGDSMRKMEANIWAILAFGGALIGFVAFLMKFKDEDNVGTITGLAGFISLIILQFSLQSLIKQEGEGALTLKFQLGYWLALAGLGVGGYLSFQRLKAKWNSEPIAVSSTNVEQNPVIKHAEHTDTTQENSREEESIHQSKKFESTGPDFSEWWQKNKLVVGIVGGVALLLIFGYYFFIRPNPVRDGKNVAAAFCKCVEETKGATSKAYEDFSVRFESYGFKTRGEARNKLSELHNQLNSQDARCKNDAGVANANLQTKYYNHPENLKKYEQSFNAGYSNCSSSSQDVNPYFTTINQKIENIQDPEPDIEKIKSDLIGQTMPGWRFAYLTEFKDARIENKTTGINTVEYVLNLKLEDNSTNAHYDAKVLTVYKKNDDGWQFSEVRGLQFNDEFGQSVSGNEDDQAIGDNENVDIFSLLGLWEGSMEQPGAGAFPVLIYFYKDNSNRLLGTIEHKSLSCSGMLNYRNHRGRNLFFTQNILSGKDRCMNGENKIIYVDANTITRIWYNPNSGSEGARGTLYRKE